MASVAREGRAQGGPATGFTLVELCWTLAIFGVLAAVGVGSLHTWAAGSRQTSTASALEALFRETQQRAVTEGRTLCIDFDLPAQSWSVFRGACASGSRVLIDGPIRPEGGVRIASATFAASGSTVDAIAFFPRGTATPGSISIARDGSDRVDTLAVEGLTGRVSRG